MQLQDHKEFDGKRVWLTAEETKQLLSQTNDVEHEIAFGLAVRCGLRSQEAVDVMPEDIIDTNAGYMLRVWEGKGSKYRETPIPERLADKIDTYTQMRDAGMETALVPRETRTLRKWITKARQQLRDETGDEGWRFLSMHDLRRTWGQQLVESDVEPGMVMLWGGWENWETFREHYLGQYSARKQQEERDKVDFL